MSGPTKAELVEELQELQERYVNLDEAYTAAVEERAMLRGTIDNPEAKALDQCIAAIDTLHTRLNERTERRSHAGQRWAAAMENTSNEPRSDVGVGAAETRRILLYLADRFDVDLDTSPPADVDESADRDSGMELTMLPAKAARAINHLLQTQPYLLDELG